MRGKGGSCLSQEKSRCKHCWVWEKNREFWNRGGKEWLKHWLPFGLGSQGIFHKIRGGGSWFIGPGVQLANLDFILA